MSGFKALRDVSVNFETDIRKAASELFSAKVDESFEDVLVKKMRDLALFNSKLNLLQAVTTSVTPQITELNKNGPTTLTEYENAAVWKVTEHQIIKTFFGTHAVKKLLTSPNRHLDPELVERKEEIIKHLSKYSEAESQFLNLLNILLEKDDELNKARQVWDETLTRLTDTQKEQQNEPQATGPLYKTLQVIVNKMELMRWLIAKLVTSRTGGYDWANDPHKRLNALALARQIHTIQDYTES